MRRILFAALFFGTFVSSVHAQSNILDKIAAKLPEFVASNPREAIYLATDKDVYSPGEIVWISGWVSELTGQAFANLSSEVTLHLFDDEGVLINGDKYKLEKSKFNGDIRLPENLPLGRYFLVASTPLHINPEDVSVKPLLVHQFYEGDSWVRVEDFDHVYRGGTNSNVRLRALNHDGTPAHRYLFNYKVLHHDRILAEGQLRTNNGAASFSVTLPENTGKFPVILELSHERGVWKSRQTLKVASDSVLVTFWPEGGSYMPEVPVKMGFNATLYGHIPVSLQGDILNSKGEIISKTGTYHPGFGLFPFKAEAGESYYLVLTSEPGKGQRIAIPGPDIDRPSVTLGSDGGQFLLLDVIGQRTAPQNYAVVVSHRFQLVWAANFVLERSARIRIPIAELEQGMHQIALFDEDGGLLSERIFYNGNPDQPNISVDGKISDGNIRVNIDAGRNRAAGSGMFSVSVTDRCRVFNNPSGIGYHFGINAWLNKDIVDLDHLLRQSSNNIVALDYFLITNRIKGFSWSDVMQYDLENPTSKRDNKTGIRGQVVDRRGNPAADARVSLLSNRDLQVYTANSDSEGNFIFPFLNPANLNDFSFTATDSQGRGNMRVIPSSGFTDQIGAMLSKLPTTSALADANSLFPSHYFAGNPGLLRKLPSRRLLASQSVAPPKNEAYKSMLQSSTNLLDVIKVIRPYNLQSGQIVFMGTQNSFYHQSGALIVVDGQRMGTSADILNTIAPSDVESINVSLDPMDIQKYTGLNNVGVIEIKTKRGGSTQAALPVPEMHMDRYESGFRVPARFLSPEAMRSGAATDLRSTLYWEPALILDQQGKTSFSVPVSSLKSDFVIVVEGADPSSWGSRIVVPVNP